MIQIAFKIVHASVKAAAPHVARHASRIAPVLFPTFAKGATAAGAVGAVGRGVQIKAKAARSAPSGSAPRGHVKPQPTFPKPQPARPGLAEKMERRVLGLAEDVAAGELGELAVKTAAKKIGEMHHKGGADPAAPPADPAAPPADPPAAG
jgi:hypothetical protein